MIYPLLRRLLFTCDPEWVHHLALAFLQRPEFVNFLPTNHATSASSLRRELWGLTFPNPIGLAAGFDKNALALAAWKKLGFGFVELGTITQHAQPGNRRPRIFRYPAQRALINRMGFPNEGADAVAARLGAWRESGAWPEFPVGINIGKSKVTPLEQAHEDYAYSFRRLRAYADYFVINVSSPNTPGLRSLQGRDQLEKIVAAVQSENQSGLHRPLLVKIAPDLTEEQVDEVLDVMQQHHCDGIVATNTTLDKSSVLKAEEGGLSGQPLQERSNVIIRQIAQRTGGKLPIIGVGGVFNAEDARAKISAGATLVQSYTGFIYEGPAFVAHICRSLAKC